MSDDDPTKPDIPSGLGADEEHTSPGLGTREAFVAITASLNRLMAACQELAFSCPPEGDPSRDRHLELLSHAFGELGCGGHDSRRITNNLRLEEKRK